VIIQSVEPDSVGAVIGLHNGDEILSINGERIRDIIDYLFTISEPEITLSVKRNGAIAEYTIEKEENEDLGVVFKEIKYRHCASKCIFCFVDQNPKGLRPALYFKDEDYRLSFLHGSYITLNNISPADIKRIIKQRLSPLYVSVHALDPEIRAYMFGVGRNDRLLEKIRILIENNIELHAQIVVCPGINDGAILDNTITGLQRFYPGVRSVAVVPVGLTKHRSGLEKIKPVTFQYARKIVSYIHRKQKGFLGDFGERFVYLADEWYLISGRRLPSLQYYGDLFQLENGVGLTRQFLKEFNAERRRIKGSLKHPKSLHLLTGTLAQPILENYMAPVLEKFENLTVKVTGIVNEFYGPSVTVSGLLSGSDFIRCLEDEEGDLFLLPPDCLNSDGLTLDDMTVHDMMQKTGKHILQYTGDLNEVWDAVNAA